MKLPMVIPRRPHNAYLLVEALVYLSVVLVLLGVGYFAMYRAISGSLALRRSAEDIARVLHLGEIWREDVRHAAIVRPERLGNSEVIRLEGRETTNAYAFDGTVLSRQSGAGPWIPVLTNLAQSTMRADKRQQVEAWRWELELKRSKAARVRPLFTFTAVPATAKP